MASNTPIVRGKISWPSFIFQVALITALNYLYVWFNIEQSFLFAAITYFIITRILRAVNSSDHRKGIKFMMLKKYSEAIISFQKSYDHFSRKPWLDKYRFITLLSATNTSYRVMALDNIAFAYGQTGDGTRAMEYYKKALELDPNDGLAQTGLKMLESAKPE